MLSHNRIGFHLKLSRLRYKYEKEKETDPAKEKLHTEQLNKIVWYSAYLVYPEYEKEAGQIVKAKQARKRKKNRVNQYVRGMFDCYEKLYFVTLTFNSDSLEKLNSTTRKKYAKLWLENNCKDYIANIDYGRQNNREHFHAFCALKDDKTEWNYGFSKIQRWKIPEDKNPAKLSSYICKLANHAGKVETGQLFRKKGGMKEVDEIPF